MQLPWAQEAEFSNNPLLHTPFIPPVCHEYSKPAHEKSGGATNFGFNMKYDLSRARNLDAIAATASAILFAATISLFVTAALFKLPSFDGAMMLNNARIFSETGKYGYFYNEFYYFPSQTDGLIILLAALFFKIFGIGLFTAQLPNLIFNIILILGILAIAEQLSGALWYSLLASATVIAVPGFTEFSTGGYGEIPVLALFLWSLIALKRSLARGEIRFAFYAGLTLGAAFITKVMGLFFIAPTVCILFVYLYRREIDFKTVVAVAAGGLLLPVLWECFRLIQVGFAGYRQWWLLQIYQIRHQSGAGGLFHSGVDLILKRAISHLSLLGNFSSTNALVFAGVLAVGALGYWLARKVLQEPSERLVFDALALTCTLFFAWWILLLPTRGAWLRRIEDGLIVLYLSYGLLGAVLLRLARRSKGLELIFATVVFVIAGVSVSRCVVSIVRELPNRREEAREVLKGARLLADLPHDSKIFGVGWWQAPQLALFSNRSFYNYQHWPFASLQRLHNAYFVTDGYARALGGQAVRFVLASSKHRVLLNGRSASIYRIDKFYPYPPPPSPMVEGAVLPSFMSRGAFDFALSRGIYHDYWSRPESEVILGRSNEQLLGVKIRVPRRLNAIGAGPIELHIASPGCVDQSFVVRPGVNIFHAPIACKGSARSKSFVVRFSLNGYVPFVHQIDADNRLIGFILDSVALEGSPGGSSDNEDREAAVAMHRLSEAVLAPTGMHIQLVWTDNYCQSNTSFGAADLRWKAASLVKGPISLFVGGGTGPQKLFAAGGLTGDARTGDWVRAGQVFTFRDRDGHQLGIIRILEASCP